VKFIMQTQNGFKCSTLRAD